MASMVAPLDIDAFGSVTQSFESHKEENRKRRTPTLGKGLQTVVDLFIILLAETLTP